MKYSPDNNITDLKRRYDTGSDFGMIGDLEVKNRRQRRYLAKVQRMIAKRKRRKS